MANIEEKETSRWVSVSKRPEFADLGLRERMMYLTGQSANSILGFPDTGWGKCGFRYGDADYWFGARNIDGKVRELQAVKIHPNNSSVCLLQTGLSTDLPLWEMNSTSAQVLGEIREVVEKGDYLSGEIGLYRVQPVIEASRIIEGIIDKTKVVSDKVKRPWEHFTMVMRNKYYRDEYKKELIKAGLPGEELFSLVFPLEPLYALLENDHISADNLLDFASKEGIVRQTSIRGHPSCQTDYLLIEKVNEFLGICRTPHLDFLRVLDEFDKRKVECEKALKEAQIRHLAGRTRDFYGLSRDIARIEYIYRQADESRKRHTYDIFSREINQILKPFMTGKKEEKKSIERPMLSKLRVLDKVKGNDTSEELDNIARTLNLYYSELTVRDILRERESYNLTEEDVSLLEEQSGRRIKDIFDEESGEKAGTDRQYDGIRLFGRIDVFTPLILKAADLLTNAKPQVAASLIYLLYQIENPFLIPSPMAKYLVSQANNRFKEKYALEGLTASYEPALLSKVERMVDEFVLAGRSWKSAWAYFGSEQAQKFLDLLLDDQYGLRLLNDLIDFAAKDYLIAPPQIVGFARQINGETQDYVGAILDLYRHGGSLSGLAINNDAIYQISGLQRAEEYGHYLSDWIDDDLRSRAILSLGGGLGLLEVRRMKALGLTGPLVVVDKYSPEILLERSLVFRNEFKYSIGNPVLTQAEIKSMLSQSDNPLFFIRETLPLSSQEVSELLLQNGIEIPVGIIFDQRASALYLSGVDFLASIRSSVNLLSQKGGLFFCTRGWADKLFVDQVLRVNKAPSTGKSSVDILLLHHTNSFFSSGKPLISGKLEPAKGIFFAEGGTRYVRQADGSLTTGQFQVGRLSEELDIQQRVKTVGLIIDTFDQRFGHLIRDDSRQLSYSRLFTVAYAKSKGLPLWIPANLPSGLIPSYEEIIDQLVKFIDAYQGDRNGFEQSDWTIRTMPREFENGIRAINLFMRDAVRNTDLLIEPVQFLEDSLHRLHQIAYTPMEDLSQQRQARHLYDRFNRKYFQDFLHHTEGMNFSHVVANAILKLVGLPDEQLPFQSLFTAKEKEVLHADYQIILDQIQRKIIFLNKGLDYRMDFSHLQTPQYFRFIIEVLEIKDKKASLWQDIIAFIDSNLDVRTFQAL